MENFFWVMVWTTMLATATSVVLFRNWFRSYKLQQALRVVVANLEREVVDVRTHSARQAERITAYETTEVYGSGINFALPTMSLMFNKGSLDEDRIQELYAELRQRVDLAKVMVLPTGMEYVPAQAEPTLPQPRARTISLDD